MAAVVFFGTPPVPVRYGSWDAWREDVRTPLPPLRVIAPETVSCALCWGQGRIWEAAPNGEGLVPHGCWECGGSGLVRREPGPPHPSG